MGRNTLKMCMQHFYSTVCAIGISLSELSGWQLTLTYCNRLLAHTMAARSQRAMDHVNEMSLHDLEKWHFKMGMDHYRDLMSDLIYGIEGMIGVGGTYNHSCG